MGTIIGRTVMPQDALGWLRPEVTEKKVNGYRNNIRAAKLGLPMWMDRWDGYPAARSRLLKAAQQADADLVMLAGDSHNAWAYGLVEDSRPAGVEFAGQAVTSGGAEGDFGADPKVVAQGFMTANPELKWADTSQRGYMMIEVTPKRVTGEWLFMRTIKARTPRWRARIGCRSTVGGGFSPARPRTGGRRAQFRQRPPGVDQRRSMFRR